MNNLPFLPLIGFGSLFSGLFVASILSSTGKIPPSEKIVAFLKIQLFDDPIKTTPKTSGTIMSWLSVIAIVVKICTQDQISNLTMIQYKCG